MTPEHWRRVEDVFQAVLDVAPVERARALDDRCGSDTELRADVERLLSDHDASSDAFESAAWTSTPLREAARRLEDTGSRVGSRLGPYRLERELGRGGMGAVYLAARVDGQFRQQVAVKLVKRGMDTDFILSRFRQERQILASLNHPYIARLLDGGSTDDGLPYFVMEHVDGQPLYDYAAVHGLETRGRLELFGKVCEALSSAHARGIVHRDVKPSNILVTPDGTPKLLDFGIAKLMSADLAGATPMPTATQMRLMTPEYASPEQVQGLPVTEASDVYAAGVLLYEPLTGRRPYEFPSRMLHVTARVICDVEPKAPSDVVLLSDTAAKRVPGRGPATPATELSRRLAGDLDAIVLKALRKEPSERYASIDALRADLRSHLESRPIEAHAFAPRSAQPVAPAPRAMDDQALAVLPLKLLGRMDDDDSAAYLGVGLADTLITRLSQLRRFSVRPTSSILKFTHDTDPFQAGRDLGVRYVVDGNLRRVGKTLRVTMQLLDVARETTAWAQQFQGLTDDVLALEDEIAGKVAESLAPQLTGSERQRLARKGTSSEEAFQSYVRGRFHWAQFTPDSIMLAGRCFEQAIALDPTYALAHVGMADFHSWGVNIGVLPASAQQAMLEHARRALELDDSLGEAHATLAIALVNTQWDFEAGERHFIRAMELNPSYPFTYELYGAALTGNGLVELGTVQSKRAEALDPLSLRTKALLAWQHYQAGLLEASLAKSTEIVELSADYAIGHYVRGCALDTLGRYDEAIEAFTTGSTLMRGAPVSVYRLPFALMGAGREAEARQVVRDLSAAAQTTFVKPFFLAMAHVAVGEVDAAFDLFEQSFAERDSWVLWFGTEPRLRQLHRHPRFLSLLRRMSPAMADRVAASLAPEAAPQVAADTRLEVGMMATASLAFTQRLMREFAEAQPGVEVVVRSIPFSDPSGGVRTRQTDVAVVWAPLDEAGLGLEPLFAQDMIALLPSDHPLAALDVVDATALAREPQLLIDGRHDRVSNDYWNFAAHRHHQPARIGATITGFEEMFVVIQAGRAVCPCPAGLASALPATGLAVRPIRGMAPAVVTACWRTDDRRPLVHAFVECARRVARATTA